MIFFLNFSEFCTNLYEYLKIKAIFELINGFPEIKENKYRPWVEYARGLVGWAGIEQAAWHKTGPARC
jgi:hypothetical protein